MLGLALVILSAGLLLVLLVWSVGGAETPDKPPLYSAAPRPRPSGASAGLRGLPGAPLDPFAVSWPSKLSSGSQPPSALAEVAGRAARAAIDAAVPARPPAVEPEPELGPQRVWRPTYMGVGPTFVDAPCAFFRPAPRLWATKLNELQWQRSLLAGVTNVPEGPRVRQGLLQFLTHDWRSAKDPYTRATAANDVTHGTCAQLAQAVPRSVNF
jgi:hypothetical protein